MMLVNIGKTGDIVVSMDYMQMDQAKRDDIWSMVGNGHENGCTLALADLASQLKILHRIHITV